MVYSYTIHSYDTRLYFRLVELMFLFGFTQQRVASECVEDWFDRP